MNSLVKNSSVAKSSPLVRFGVIADVQYADSDDKKAWYNPNKTRFYRNSLKQVEKAFKFWESVDPECPVSFILQLGDIIDALNTSTCSQSAIDRTLSCFLNNPKMPTFHTVGNHEFYNFNRNQMAYLFNKYLFEHTHSEHSFGVRNSKCPNDGSYPLYYKFSPIKGLKMISLDTYDISVLGYDATHPKYKLASEILAKYHGHSDFELWDCDKTLNGADKRFQSSNGALSEQQLDWLDRELQESDNQNEVVIVFGHVGLHPQSCGWDSLLWNYDQVLECFNRHRCVAGYFSGHAHNSGYAIHNGIHFIVFHGIIETDPKEEAFATVTVFEEHIHIDGKGVERSMTLALPRPISSVEGHLPLNQSGESGTAIEDVHLVEIEIEV